MAKICYEKAAWLFKGTEQKMVEKESEEYKSLIEEGWVSDRTKAVEPTEPEAEPEEETEPEAEPEEETEEEAAEKPKSSRRGRKNEK